MKRLLLLVCIAGCSEARAELERVVQGSPAQEAVVGQAPRLPLGERLALEAAARPEHAVRPAQLRAALAARGVVLTRQRQVLASPVGAAYCEALSGEGLAFSLCEYPDVAAAARGLQRSRSAFDALIPGRTLVQRDNSLLTLTAPADAAGERQRQLVRETFATLTAP